MKETFVKIRDCFMWQYVFSFWVMY